MFERNQRKFIRVTYQCSLTLWEKGGFSTIMANTVNIGVGGILVNLDRGLMVGAKVDIKMDFPNKTVLECCGRVQRCKEYTEQEDISKNFFSVAIVFEDLNESQKLLIKTQVDKFLSQQNIF